MRTSWLCYQLSFNNQIWCRDSFQEGIGVCQISLPFISSNIAFQRRGGGNPPFLRQGKPKDPANSGGTIQFGTEVKFCWYVIVTTGLRIMHFPCPGFFLRWNSNLQQVDFNQGFASNNILGLVVLAVNDGFLHSHTCVISPFFCLHFCHLEIQI